VLGGRFDRGARRRGGATFTLLLFLLLLVSSGLMYYYFQRTRLLEHELTKWRAGEKPTAAEIAASGDGASIADTAKGIMDKVKDMPASTAIRKLTGTAHDEPREIDGPAEEAPDQPAGEGADKPKPVISEVKPTPGVAEPAPGKVVEQQFAATQAPRQPTVRAPQPAADQKGYVPPKSPYPKDIQAARDAVRGADEPQPAKPALRMSVPQRPAGTKTRTPIQTRAKADPADEVGAVLRGTTTR
jgi:hypothetical protein